MAKGMVIQYTYHSVVYFLRELNIDNDRCSVLQQGAYQTHDKRCQISIEEEEYKTLHPFSF